MNSPESAKMRVLPTVDILRLKALEPTCSMFTVVGESCLGECELPTGSAGELIICSRVRDEENRIIVFQQSNAKPTSPWKGMKMYTAVVEIGTITTAHDLDGLSFGKVSKCGWQLFWSLRDSSFILTIAVPNSHIFASYSDAAYVGHLEAVVAKDLPQVYNRLLLIAFPQFQKDFENHIIAAEPGSPLKHKENVDEFYSKLVTFNKESRPKTDQGQQKHVKIAGLRSQLYPYQSRALEFMLARELGNDPVESFVYRHVKLDCGLFYFPAVGILTETNDIGCLARGGILADEMGLGKTVEILALIVSNMSETQKDRKSDVTVVGCQEIEVEAHEAIEREMKIKRKSDALFYAECSSSNVASCSGCETICDLSKLHWKKEFSTDGRFRCPHCLEETGITDVDGTLIVVPSALLHQLYTEIRKHVEDHVKIDLYKGVITEGYKHPDYLRQFDIVICSYETLQHELNVIAAKSFSISMRKRPRKQSNSPLEFVRWWRVCLDECQLIESRNCKAAQMCATLHAKHRWCLSGTPLQRSVLDIYGALSFLGIHPFSFKSVFEKLFYNAFVAGQEQPLLHLMSQLMWRSTKASVAGELVLPDVENHVKQLTFHPLEERLYHERIRQAADRIANRIGALPADELPLSTLPPKQMAMVMQVLTQLRLSVVTGDAHIKKGTVAGDVAGYSPQLVFTRLVASERLRYDEAQRSLVASMNALAGIHWLEGDLPAALECYERVLSACENAKSLNTTFDFNALLKDDSEDNANIKRPFAVDDLQMIHVFINVKELALHCEAARELITKEQIETRLRTCRVHYMRREVTQMRIELNEIGERGVIESDVYADKLPLLLSLIMTVAEDAAATRNHAANNRLEIMLENLTVMFMERYHNPLRTAAEMCVALRSYREVHKKLVDLLRDVAVIFLETDGPMESSPHFIRMLECKHNPDMTKYDAEMEEYRKKIKNGELNAKVPEDPWVHYDYDCRLCLLRQHCEHFKIKGRMLNTDGSLREHFFLKSDLKLLMDLTSSRVKKALRHVYNRAASYVSSWVDDLSMSMRLAQCAEEIVFRCRELNACARRFEMGMKITLTLPQRLGPVRVTLAPQDNLMNMVKYSLVADEDGHKRQVDSSRGRLRYLCSLQELKPPACHICLEDVNDWFVFACAHSMCVRCFEVIRKRAVQGRISCTVCRLPTLVSLAQRVRVETEGIIPGVHLPIKINAIIACIKSIVEEDPEAKVLVFSSLPDALSVLEQFLGMVPISTLSVAKASPLQFISKVAQFRTSASIRVLLLPLKRGNKGLNLFEANHVLFVEPTMNRAVITQAIGRVNRIGQTKAMHSYQFVVKGTLEEMILQAQQSHTEEDLEEKWTVGAIRTLFSQEQA